MAEQPGQGKVVPQGVAGEAAGANPPAGRLLAAHPAAQPPLLGAREKHLNAGDVCVEVLSHGRMGQQLSSRARPHAHTRLCAEGPGVGVGGWLGGGGGKGLWAVARSSPPMGDSAELTPAPLCCPIGAHSQWHQSCVQDTARVAQPLEGAGAQCTARAGHAQRRQSAVPCTHEASSPAQHVRGARHPQCHQMAVPCTPEFP